MQLSSTTTALAVSVTLTSDELFEGTEVFHVELEVIQSEGFIGVIDPSQASISITDTNGKTVSLHCQSIAV